MARLVNKNTMTIIPNGNPADFNDDWLVDPDLSAVLSVPVRYWKHDNGIIREMNAEEKEQANEKTGAEKVELSIKFGQSLIKEFGGRNVDANVPTVVVKSIMTKLEPVLDALTSGSLNLAIHEIDLITPDEYLSAETIAYFRQKIVDFLATL